MFASAHNHLSARLGPADSRVAFSLVAVLLVVGTLVAFARFVRRLRTRRSRAFPLFPKRRTVLLEKSVGPGYAQPCSTDAEFQYQIQDFCSMDDLYPAPEEDVPRPIPHYQRELQQRIPDRAQSRSPARSYDRPHYAGQPRMQHEFSWQLGEPASWRQPFWKQEPPVYVHPTVQEELPMELWLPDELAVPKPEAPLSASPESPARSSAEPEHTYVPGDEAATPFGPDQRLTWSQDVDEPADELTAVMFGPKKEVTNSPVPRTRPASEVPRVFPPPADRFAWSSPPDFGPLNDRPTISPPTHHAPSKHSPFSGFSKAGEPSPMSLSAYAKRGHHMNALPSPPHSARGSSESGSESSDHQFKCPNCSASFRIRGYLTRHMKKHAETMKFNCPFYRCLSDDRKCHQTGGFSRRDTFKMHLKARHFAYPKGTARKSRPNCAGKCCGCNLTFANNEVWIESHLLAGECPMTEVENNYDTDQDSA